jgi:O-antigen/teichoic acid export membrane protein
MTRFGLGYSGGALLLAKPTDIVGPLIVGPFLGAEAVGFVALISRIIDTLGFAQRATRRLSLVVFGRVQSEKDRLAAAIRDSMALQLLALGIPLLAFGLVADAAIPALFGSEWQGASLLYPTFALAFFLSAVFSVQSYALAVLDRNGVVLLSCAIQLAVLAALCWLLIPVMDLDGVGVARLVSVAGLAVIHWSLRTQVEISYQKALVWLLTLGPAIALATFPLPWNAIALVVGLAGVLTATGREQLRELLAVATSFVSPRHRRASQPSEVVP